MASGLELLQDLLHAEPVAALQGTTSTLLPSAQGTAHSKSCSPASPGRAAHCTGHTSLCSYLSFSNLHVVVTRLLIKQHTMVDTVCSLSKSLCNKPTLSFMMALPSASTQERWI